MSEIDFSRIDIQSVLEHFNISRIRPIGDEFMFSCPFPEHRRGDRNPSSSINTKGQWHCFGCGRSGNLVHFIAELEGVSLAIATRWVKEAYGGKYGYATSLMKELDLILQEKPHTSTGYLPEEYVSLFKVNWEWVNEQENIPKGLYQVLNRGIEPKTLSAFDIGFDPNSQRIVIPLRDVSGKLVGFKGRATKESERSKYLGIGDKGDSNYYGFPTCKTSNYVFGINTSDVDVIVVEGEFDCIYMRQLGFGGAVALGGSNPSENQIKQLRQKAQSITLLLDPDTAGEKAVRVLSKNLIDSMPIRIARLKENDPNDSTKEEITQALANAQSSLTQ